MIRTLSAIAVAAFAMALPAHAAESASFSGSGSSQFFGFELEGPAQLTGSIVSSFSGLAGYDITSVSIDGVALADLLPEVGDDYFAFNLDMAPGLHTIFVKGLSHGGSFVGSYSLTPVPEPRALALSLGGLGAVGWVARRRQPRA